MDDRGVSEVVGFVLVFSVITMTIGIVSVVGLGGLHDAQQAEQVNNVERAFDVLDTNVKEIQRHEAPSRSTEIRLGGDRMEFGEVSTVTIEGANEEATIETRPLVYTDGDIEIVYELGGIFRSDDGGSVMLKDPGYVLSDDRSSVLLLVTTKPSDQTGVAGHQTMLVRGSHQHTELLYHRTTDEVTVTIDSPRADAWEQYFERQAENQDAEPEDVLDRDDTKVEYTIEAGETSVSVTWIRLRFA
jgi:hypothetical protein